MIICRRIFGRSRGQAQLDNHWELILLLAFCIFAFFELFPLIFMSRASKLTLAATGLGTAGIIYFVHWAQENDRAVRIGSWTLFRKKLIS